MRRATAAQMLACALAIAVFAGSAAAANKTFTVTVNGVSTENIDTNYSANASFKFSNPTYWDIGNIRNIFVRLYLTPNNATGYVSAPEYRIGYSTTTGKVRTSSSAEFACTLYCYADPSWDLCSAFSSSAAVSMIDCEGYYSKSYGLPTYITFTLPSNAPFQMYDKKSIWTGRDYDTGYAGIGQPPVNEYWGNTTIATPYPNITNFSEPSKRTVNLYQTFSYNITVENENTTNHTGKAYGVVLYSLTEGLSVFGYKSDIENNRSYKYTVSMYANRTMESFLLGAMDNGTAERRAFNTTRLIDNINITDQLIVKIVEPTNQSYKGETKLTLVSNVTYFDGSLADYASVYVNITGVVNKTYLTYNSTTKLYLGTYTITKNQSTPWELIFYASKSGNSGTNNTYFYDRIAPTVENLTAQDITDRQNATINASAWDAVGVAEVKAEVYWAATGLLKNYTLTKSSGNSYSARIPQSEVVPGTNNVTIFARDTSGYAWNTSARTAFKVNDTTPPILENVSIRDATEGTNASASISAWDLMNVSSAYVTISNGTTYWYYSIQKQGGNTYNVTFAPLQAGTYGLTFYALDTSWNTNSTNGTLHINDTTPPVISVIQPESGAQIRYGESQSITANVTDNYAGVDKVWMVVDSNQSKRYGLNYANGQYNYSITEEIGAHSIQIYANDTRNNTRNASASFTVTTVFAITDLSPSLPSPQNAGKNITWTTSVENASGTIYYQYNLSTDGGTTWRIARDRNASNTFTWAVNASYAGMNLVRVYVSNSTASLGNRTSAAYNISTSYRMEASALQYGTYMRGENITFAVKAFDAQNAEITNAQASATLAEGSATLGYNGTHYYGTFPVPENATTGNWTANISASDPFNAGSVTTRLNVSSAYALQIFEPYANDSYIRGDSARVNLSIRNARGELLRNISGVNAYLQKGGSTKQAVGMSYTEEHYMLYFPFAFNTTDAEGAWEVLVNASRTGNSGNASTAILLNASLRIDAPEIYVEVYNPILLNFTIDRQNTARQKENASLGSDAYFWLNDTESAINSNMPVIGNTPITKEYSHDTENNGSSVNRTGQWKLRINISNNRNYGETETRIAVRDTKKPALKAIRIGDRYKGVYFENSNGAQSYPNDTVLLQAEYIDNFNATSANMTITSPSGTNTTIQMEKHWSKDCRSGLGQQDCYDALGSSFGGSVYQASKWNASFAQTEEAGNYTVTAIESSDGSGNIDLSYPGYTFEVSTLRIGMYITPQETNISSPVSITATVYGNLTALDYVRINISGKEGSFEYSAATNLTYTSARSDWHTVIAKVRSANYLAENSSVFWVNYGTPVLTTKLADDQTQLNGTYKTVNMSVTAIGGDLGNVRIGSTTSNESILLPDFGNTTMAVLGDINNSQKVVFPFGFTANETGTVNITMILKADQAKTTQVMVTYSNYSIVRQDTQAPEILYVNTTTAAGYANLNESIKVYARIKDNVDVASASLDVYCTNTSYNRTGENMSEEAINTEFVWSYQFAFTDQPANCTFTVNALDTSNLSALPATARLNASTRYFLATSKAGEEPLMRGERVNVSVSIATINGNSIEGAGVTYTLIKPDNSSKVWAGGQSDGYTTLPSDMDGTYRLAINASKDGNAGNVTTSFLVNSTLKLDPQYTQSLMRGDRLVFNTSIKNSRGQNYDATVNLTLLNGTYALTKTFSRYSHAQTVPLTVQLGNNALIAAAYDSQNNTGNWAATYLVLPANLSIHNLRVANTLDPDLSIGRGDNVTITLEVLAQNFEHISGANVTAGASTGETINFTLSGSGTYSATAVVNISNNTAWEINASATYRDNNPGQLQHSISPINKKWRDTDNDSYLEFAEDPAWLELYDRYMDTSPQDGAYSTEFAHFPLSPHNGFMIITPLSYYPDVFWSPYDDVNTSVRQWDIDPAKGNGIGNPYEYYVDKDGDGNFERQYADGQANTISGKKLAYNNVTHFYAFDLQNIGRYSVVQDLRGDTTIFCGGARYTMLGYILGNSEQSEYILGKSNKDIPDLYWDARTGTSHTIFNDALNSYYVEADGRIGKTEGDLLISTSNNTCTFAIAACGNGACQAQYGETTVTCPADCTSAPAQSGSPGGGGTPSSGAAAPATQAQQKNATAEKETEKEGLDVIVQSPTNLLVTKGNNITFQITLASTSREYPLQVSFRTGCCGYSYYPESLYLPKGGSADVSVHITTNLSTRAGEHTSELTVSYRNYTKSRTILIKVEESPAVLELYELRRAAILLQESIGQLNHSNPETKQVEETYASMLGSIAEAERAIIENDADLLSSTIQKTRSMQQGLADTVKVLTRKQGIEEQRAAFTVPEQPSYMWAIVLVAVLIVASAASVVFKEQIHERMFKKPPAEELKEQIGELQAEEGRIVQMKKSTEHEYFSRKLDQKTFMHIMSEYESKQIDIKARIAEAQQKLADLTKPKSEKEKVELLELQKMPEGRRILEEAKKIRDALEKGDYEGAFEAYRSALDAYNSNCKGLALEEQKFLYGELNRQYSRLEEFRTATKKTNDLYSALLNCKNCISNEKYDLAKHFFEQAENLHRELTRSELFRKSRQHEEIEKLYKEISEFHKLGA